MDDVEIRDLIGTIYEAPLDPRKWERVVKELRRATRSRQGHLFSASIHDNLQTLTSSRDIYLGFDNERLSFCDALAIGQRVHDPSLTDPHLLRFGPSQAGKSFITSEVLPVDEWKRSPFYNEFARFFEAFQGVAAMMIHQDGRMHALALYRSENDPFYDEHDKRLLDIFVPHLRRSLALNHRLQMAKAQTSILRGSLDTLTSAIALLDQNGKLIFLNTAAERLLKRCPELYVRCNRLCARRHSETLKLERLGRIATNGDGRRPVGGAVLIERGAAGAPPLQVMAAPVPMDGRASLVTGMGPVAMLVIYDPSEDVLVPEEIVSAMFGLTAAEARLLLALSNGQTLKEFCGASQVTQNTARTHLKSLFAKTGTKKQSDLVRLMSGLAHSVGMEQC